MIFVATKKDMATNTFHPSLLLLYLGLGSEIRDPGSVKIRIRDKHPGSATLHSPLWYLFLVSTAVLGLELLDQLLLVVLLVLQHVVHVGVVLHRETN